MKANYIWNKETENMDTYLSRAALWLDSVQNGEPFGKGIYLGEVLSETEITELENYIFELIEPVLSHMAKFYIRNWKLDQLGDDYKNQFYFDVWKNLFKFNNPRFKKTEDYYSFKTFANMYAKEPLRTVKILDEGMTRRVHAKRQIINRTRKFIIENRGIKPDSITVEDIFQNMSNVSTVQLSRDEILAVIQMMQPKYSIDAFVDGDELMAIDQEIACPDEAIRRRIYAFLNKMRPMQQFIFCQNYERCNEHYACMTVSELCGDPLFVKICKNDKYGQKHVAVDEKLLGTFNIEGMSNLELPFLVSTKFVRNERERVRANLIKLVQECDYSEEDLQDNLFDVMDDIWEEIMKSVSELNS